MALLTICGRLVLESAGPVWHLVGVVKRDKARPNRLTFKRRRDALSKRITGAANRFLPSVQLTDPSGKSVKLTDVQLIASITQRLYTPRLGSSHSEHDTNEPEEYSLTFSKILVENLMGSTSTTDDWTSNNQ